MCGRIEIVITNRHKLEGHYGITLLEGFAYPGIINNRYNIAPTAVTPLITAENSEHIVAGHWGYVPSWTRAETKAKEVINARSETVFEKPYFKSSILSRRCLIPVTGFFEWKREGNHKTPFRFHRSGEIFSLAGLYTTITGGDGIELPHYAIITREANELMAPIHNRIPVIIDPSQEMQWVEEGLPPEEIERLLGPIPSDFLIRTEVSTLVNNPRNDTPEVILPVSK